MMKGTSEQVPIVALTAFDVYGMEEAASEAGCNEYISKPFDLDYLEKVMKGLGFIL
jgi:CheY-like chemotaxis protein